MFGMYKSRFPKSIGEVKGEHLTRINSIRLLITFKMWRVVTLVGTASIFKKFRRCSERAGIGGGGSSEPEEATRRRKRVKRDFNKD